MTALNILEDVFTCSFWTYIHEMEIESDTHDDTKSQLVD